MISNDVFTEELLQQATEQYAEAIIASLSDPEECNHKFSKQFEKKMQTLLHPKTICIMTPEYISK